MEKINQRLTIPHWPEDDRPREKMMKHGYRSLSDAELLAIVLGSGSRNETAVELSRRILHSCHDNLNELAMLTIDELCKRYKGVGAAKAISIVAALELANRRSTSKMLERTKIQSSKDLFELFQPLMTGLTHEEFWIVLLNGAHKLIEIKRLTQGGAKQTVVDIPMLLKLALEKSAQAIAVAHNHPSGRVDPSVEDNSITKRIKSGCQAIGINFLDHLVVAHSDYFSYADSGEL